MKTRTKPRKKKLIIKCRRRRLNLLWSMCFWSRFYNNPMCKGCKQYKKYVKKYGEYKVKDKKELTMNSYDYGIYIINKKKRRIKK